MRAALRGLVRVHAVGFLVAAVASCGGKDDESAAAASNHAKGKAQAKSQKPLPADERMAMAVSVGKTARIAELKYDLLSRPAAGQPVEIELAVTPQSQADSLDLEVRGMNGLEVVAGGSAAFQHVAAGEVYKAKVLAQPAADGLYYLSVTAKLASKVQSDSATFSVPVVVAPVPDSSKPAAGAASSAASTGAAPPSGGAAAAKPSAAEN